MKYVLDATAIRSGMTISGDGWFTAPGVVNEIRLGRQARTLELLLDISLTVMMPEEKSLDTVKDAAAKTGDLGQLSETDIEILALGLQLGATIISDDYSVQNVASILKISFQTDLSGIRNIITWTYRCRGCGRYYEDEQIDCPVCGSEVRRVRKK